MTFRISTTPSALKNTTESPEHEDDLLSLRDLIKELRDGYGERYAPDRVYLKLNETYNTIVFSIKQTNNMKKDIFEGYVDKVTSHFGLTRDQLFTKDKSRHLSDARHVLYYLCHQRPMTSTYIKHYMGESGYVIDLPSIGHGLKKVENHMNNDPDYITLINKLK